MVKGCYPSELVEKWDLSNAKKRSENHRPDFYTPHNFFLIMEMDYGGIDLESFKIESSHQISSIFWQIVYALSLAETKLEFEHRDLYFI